MRPWTHLQDWGTLIAGLSVTLSLIWVSTTGERNALWALIVLGVLLAVTALWSLAMPGVVATKWLTVLFGVLLFIAAWVLSYTDRAGAAWISWSGGDRGGARRLHGADQQPDPPAGDPALAGGARNRAGR
jgi:SPW repeat